MCSRRRMRRACGVSSRNSQMRMAPAVSRRRTPRAFQAPARSRAAKRSSLSPPGTAIRTPAESERTGRAVNSRGCGMSGGRAEVLGSAANTEGTVRNRTSTESSRLTGRLFHTEAARPGFRPGRQVAVQLEAVEERQLELTRGRRSLNDLPLDGFVRPARSRNSVGRRD